MAKNSIMSSVTLSFEAYKFLKIVAEVDPTRITPLLALKLT